MLKVGKKIKTIDRATGAPETITITKILHRSSSGGHYKALIEGVIGKRTKVCLALWQ